jgi:hypothetical protein
VASRNTAPVARPSQEHTAYLSYSQFARPTLETFPCAPNRISVPACPIHLEKSPNPSPSLNRSQPARSPAQTPAQGDWPGRSTQPCILLTLVSHQQMRLQRPYIYTTLTEPPHDHRHRVISHRWLTSLLPPYIQARTQGLHHSAPPEGTSQVKTRKLQAKPGLTADPDPSGRRSIVWTEKARTMQSTKVMINMTERPGYPPPFAVPHLIREVGGTLHKSWDNGAASGEGRALPGKSTGGESQLNDMGFLFCRLRLRQQ